MSEQPKRPVETSIEWRRFADENLLVAEQALVSGEPVWHTICFLCQSAAEKYAKAYLIANGWTLTKTHDIVVLLGLCSDYDTAFAALITDSAVLNEYIVSGRYPGDLAYEEITRADAQEAIELARRIRDLVAACLDLPGA